MLSYTTSDHGMRVTYDPNSVISLTRESPFHSLREMLPAAIAFFDLLHDDIILHDLEGDLIYANPALLDHLGIRQADQLTHCLTHAQREEYKQQLQATLTTRGQRSMVCYFETGKPHLQNDQHLSFYPIINTEQQLLGVMVHRSNQQHQQQLHLESKRTQKAYMRSLIDNFPYPIWMKNESGTFVSVNRQFCAEFGFDHPRDVLGKNDRDLFSHEMAEQFWADDLEVMESGHDKRVIEKIRRVDGTMYWGYSHKAPVRADQGIIGTVGFSRDVSEERRLQAEISELENEYASLVNSLPIAIMVYDMQCRRLLVNAHYSTLVRSDGHEFIGKTPSERWSSNILNLSGEDYEARLQQVLTTGEPAFFDMIYSRDTEGTSINDVKLIPRRNKQGDICGVIAIVQDVTAIHESRQHIEYQANHDALTGLPNRLLLAKRMASAAELANRRQQRFAMMLLDLDGFKSINDSMGHNVGDRLLQQVAERLRSVLPDNAFCCRLGGDEFAVLLENLTHLHDAQEFANHLLQAMHAVYSIDHAEYFISASIGIALYPDDTLQSDDLIRLADTALYAAKDAGRNTWCCYDASFSEQTERRFHLANALRNAILQDELSLVFQPIVDIRNRTIQGVEALCRWQSRQLGVVNPSEFIPVAEHTGLMMQLGLHIMGLAFEAAYRINHASRVLMRVSVNVSARQFNNVNFIEQVIQLLHKHQCQPIWVKFEITETLLLEYNPEVLRKLTRLSNMGIMIVLDDFGTGHSSLSYLMKFPIQQIKIDRSFIHDIVINPNSARLIKAIIALVKSMDKELVAEGLENEQQAKLIHEFGCRMVQGYLYSKPLQLSQLLSYAAQNYVLPL